MNKEHLNMANKESIINLGSIPEADFPIHLHGKIMKRVFFAGYGKYLYLSSGVLFLNLGVLARELWRTIWEFRPLSETFDLEVLVRGISNLPVPVLITTGAIATATIYAFHIIVSLRREYKTFVVIK